MEDEITPDELDRQRREFEEAWQLFTCRPFWFFKPTSEPIIFKFFYPAPNFEDYADAFEYMLTGQRSKFN